MKKQIAICLTAIFAATMLTAAQPQRGKATRSGPGRVAKGPALKGAALVTLDYFDEAGILYFWTGSFYMSNLFKPAGGSYPLQVLALEVRPGYLDGSTTTGTPGTLDGVGVFQTDGTVITRQLGVAATVNTWTTIPLSSPPTIATGNFYGGLWNQSIGNPTPTPDVYFDGGIQSTSINWTGPPGEPLDCLVGASAAAAGPFTPNACGGAYPTSSAASVRAQINTNVPVELMRFAAE